MYMTSLHHIAARMHSTGVLLTRSSEGMHSKHAARTDVGRKDYNLSKNMKGCCHLAPTHYPTLCMQCLDILQQVLLCRYPTLPGVALVHHHPAQEYALTQEKATNNVQLVACDPSYAPVAVAAVQVSALYALWSRIQKLT